MERTVANNPGPNPPSHALTMTAQRNSDTGAVCKWNDGNREMISAAVTASTAIPYLQTKGGLRHRRGAKYVQFRPSSVAQAAFGLEVRDRCTSGDRCTDHFPVAVIPLANCSCITVSLCRHGQCVAWWIWARVIRDCSLHSRFQLLLLGAGVFVRCKAGRDPARRRFLAIGAVCGDAERCPKNRYRITQACARRFEGDSSRARKNQRGFAGRER